MLHHIEQPNRFGSPQQGTTLEVESNVTACPPPSRTADFRRSGTFWETYIHAWWAGVVCIHIRHIRLRGYACVCVYIYICVYTCVYTYIYICIYIHVTYTPHHGHTETQDALVGFGVIHYRACGPWGEVRCVCVCVYTPVCRFGHAAVDNINPALPEGPSTMGIIIDYINPGLP